MQLGLKTYEGGAKAWDKECWCFTHGRGIHRALASEGLREPVQLKPPHVPSLLDSTLTRGGDQLLPALPICHAPALHYHACRCPHVDRSHSPSLLLRGTHVQSDTKQSGHIPMTWTKRASQVWWRTAKKSLHHQGNEEGWVYYQLQQIQVERGNSLEVTKSYEF